MGTECHQVMLDNSVKVCFYLIQIKLMELSKSEDVLQG